jgi:hypothetical protein
MPDAEENSGKEAKPPLRILSLDGGGTWALIEVMALQQVYGDPQLKGHDLLRKFDLVTANSGGSMVAAALAANLSLQEILDLFLIEDRRREIFVDLPWYAWLNVLRLAIGGPRYANSAKLEGLKRILSAIAATPLSALPESIGPNYRGERVHFLIPAFDYDRKRATFYRSNTASPTSNFPHDPCASSLVEAAHASSTAPVRFFDAPSPVSERNLWDGAISGYNNPVLAGVVEALAAGAPAASVSAFSLGTASVYLPRDGRAVDDILLLPTQRTSITGDIAVLGQSIIDDPPDAASFQAHVALDQRLPARAGDWIADSSVVRLNPLIQPWRANESQPWDFPKGFDRNEFERLLALEVDALRQVDIKLIQKLAQSWIDGDVPNQPIRTNARLECEIGHAKFKQAAAEMRRRAP